MSIEFLPSKLYLSWKKEKNRSSYVSHRHRSLLNYRNKWLRWNKLLELLVTLPHSTLFSFASPNFPDYFKTHSGARRIKHSKPKDLSFVASTTRWEFSPNLSQNPANIHKTSRASPPVATVNQTSYSLADSSTENMSPQPAYDRFWIPFISPLCFSISHLMIVVATSELLRP